MIFEADFKLQIINIRHGILIINSGQCLKIRSRICISQPVFIISEAGFINSAVEYEGRILTQMAPHSLQPVLKVKHNNCS